VLLNDSGVYVLLIEVPPTTAGSVQVGRRGEHFLPAGPYLYVGSARRGLSKRIARHEARRKQTHWHVDAVTLRAGRIRSWVWPHRPGLECRLARAVVGRGLGQVWVGGCGSSDCSCASHLFRATVSAGRLQRLLCAQATPYRDWRPGEGQSSHEPTKRRPRG